MKRITRKFGLFIVSLLSIGLLACTSENSFKNEDHEQTREGDWTRWYPYYFMSFRYIVSFHPISSDNRYNNDKKPDREILFVLDNSTPAPAHKVIPVPEEKYDEIRKELGDTVKFLMTDAQPGGFAYIHDFTNVNLTSNLDYEGVPAGESLNSIVNFTYKTCMPWIKARHYDNNGVQTREPVYSNITIPLNELKLADFNACNPCGKITFPSAPVSGQQFTIEFNGGTRKVTSVFTIPPQTEEDWDWSQNYYN